MLTQASGAMQTRANGEIYQLRVTPTSLLLEGAKFRNKLTIEIVV